LVRCLENLRRLAHAPGVAFTQMPPDAMLPDYDLEEREDTGGGTMERLEVYTREHGIVRMPDPYEGRGW
jgi:hypothetical protein